MGSPSMQVVLYERSTMWEWFIENEALILKIVRVSCRGRADLQDELYEQCLDRFPRLWELYDPNKGAKLSTYVYRSLRFYLWKWMNANAARLDRFEALELDIEKEHSFDFDTHERVQSILEKLPKFERDILIMRHFKAMTYERMGEVLGVCKSTARNYVLTAEAKAREQ
jgi:RNA polymerase sigma factor (sigma-70 family)